MTEFLLRAADWWLGTAIGGGLVLLAGCCLMRLTCQPAARQRLGEYAVFAALIVAGLRLLPAWLPAPWSTAPVTEAVELVEPEMTWVAMPADAGPAEWQTIDAPPGAAPSSAWTWRYVTVYTVAAYLLVAAALASRWLLGQWALGRLLRQARPAAPRVRRLFTAMAAGAVWPLPQLRLSQRLRAPVCFGLRRPAVLLPEPMDDAGDTQLRWVFAHELTHLQRRDPWSSWGLGLAQAVYFFLPWFWWVRRQVRLCQEYVADAAAAQAGTAADEYAEFLVSLARGAVPLGATGLGSSSDLLRRVQMLLQPSTRVHGSWPRGRALLAAGGLLTVAVLAGGVGLRAETPKDDKKTEEPSVAIFKDPLDTAGVAVFTDGAETNADGEPVKVFVKLLDDLDEKKEDKDGKPADKKVEKKVRMSMVIDTGNGPVTIPLDGNADNMKEQIEKAVKKAREQAEIGQKRAQSIQKAMEFLKGELSEDQIKQLQKHIEELRAQKTALHEQHQGAMKAWAGALKLAEDANPKQEKATAEAVQLHLNELMSHAQAGSDPHRFIAMPAGGSRLGAHVKKPSADLADQLDLPKDQGLVIVEVVKDSAAAKAGLKANDIILEMAGKPVKSEPAAFVGSVRELKADDEVVVIVLRKGHKEKIAVKVPEPKKDGPVMLWQEGGAKGGIAIEGKIDVTPEAKKDGTGKMEWRFVPKVAPPRAAKDEDGGKFDKEVKQYQLKLIEMGKTLGPNHPAVAEVQQIIDELQKANKSPKVEKKEQRQNRTVSVTINNGKLTAEQKEDDVTITVTGTVDDRKVDVEKITVNDGGAKKSYKALADVPEKHRDAVKRLISNTDKSPVMFQFQRHEEK